MPYCISGLRIGVKIWTPTGFCINGGIEEREHIEYLREETGYKLKRCAGVPEWKPSEEELAEIDAADRMLGIHRGESGTTAVERAIKKGMRDWLAPLRKAFHLNPTARRF